MILAGLMIAHSSIAWACECVRRENLPADQWIKTFDGAVFQGKVLTVRQVGSFRRSLGFRAGNEVLFQVDVIWKGIGSSRVKVLTGNGGGDCGIPFVVGRTYFVAANFSADANGSLVTGICSTVGLDMSTLGKLGGGKNPLQR